MLLLLIPIIGIFLITVVTYKDNTDLNVTSIKKIGLTTSIINLFVESTDFFL